MRFNSLKGRLLLTASIILILFLGFTAWVLEQAFKRSLQDGVYERMQVHIYLLLAAVDEEQGSLYFPEAFQEPRLNQMSSGLFAFVGDPAGNEIWRSPSAMDLTLDVALYPKQLEQNEVHFGQLQEFNPPMFYYSFGVVFGNSEAVNTFTVLETMEPYLAELTTFRESVRYWLGGAALLLITLQLLVMRWGLSPLQRVAEDLQGIEDGRTDQLSGHYPTELEGLVKNINLLIASERQQRERYRTTLNDLAHSLKTPLAVVQSTVSGQTISEDSKGVIRQQVERMDEIVRYQLHRAVASGSVTLQTSIDVLPIIEQIIGALKKVYAEKKVRCDMQVDKQAFFRGDKRDLMEMMGNLLDNGFKYCRAYVKVLARVIVSGEKQYLQLEVQDDGPGISTADRQRVLQRGIRADTSQAGQGIGLAVVMDIVSSYQGEVCIEDGDYGGVAMILRFSLC